MHLNTPLCLGVCSRAPLPCRPPPRRAPQSYETLADFVVPRSSAVVAEDNDYCVFSVVLFRRVMDSFKTAARSRGFQARTAATLRDVG